MVDPGDTTPDDLSRQPWLYPGTPLERSGLMHDGTYTSLSPREGRRLGQARVSFSDRHEPLDVALLDANAASVDDRFLVVAVGSNSSRAVMQRKFDQSAVSTTAPFIRAHVTGVRVGHSAHVSRPGYIPATPVLDSDAATDLVASLLDAEQLAALDATEPNYVRCLMDAGEFPFELEGGEKPESFYTYASRHGVVAPPGARPLELMSQDALILRLQTDCPAFGLLFPGEPRSVMEKLARDGGLRAEARAALINAGWSKSVGP